jgi:hypothetical protein
MASIYVKKSERKMIFTRELLFEAKCLCISRRKPHKALHLQIVSRIFRHPGQCTEGGKSKNFSIEHISPAESKISHQARGRSDDGLDVRPKLVT